MSDTSSIADTPTIQKVLWRKRWQACAVVALASFLLISMIWPLATRGYESRAQIEVDVEQNGDAVARFKTILDEVVLRNLSENALKRSIEQVRLDKPSQIMDRLVKVPSIRPMFQVSMKPQGDNGTFVIDVKYSGKGTASENHLLNVLTTNVARDFLANPLASMGTGPKGVPTLGTPGARQEILENARNLNETAQHSIDLLEQRVLNGSDEQERKRSPFMVVSKSTQVSDAQMSNPAYELGQLRQTVQELTSMVERAHNDQSSTNGAIFSVREVRSRPMKPIGCDPKWPNLILLGLFSGIFGTAVAFHYSPFEAKGFQNVGSIASRLGIPVAATLNNRLSATEPDRPKAMPWANRVVSYAELFLFAITILVLGFCFINSEIREAFTDNLFHGFSRIVWMFRN